MKVPADVYARSARVYRGLEDLTYPFHDATFTVTHCGRICFHGRKINLSHVFAGQNVGVTQVGERIWLVTFMHYDLGYFDDEVGGWSRSRIPSARKCYLCARNNLSPM
jgi:putative transposase